MITLEQIIAELNLADDSVFPREALKNAILQQKAITPVLLDIIESVVRDPLCIDDKPAFVYALYLLAQFREKNAYPLIVQYFRDLGHEDDALNPTGDLITEDLNSILASVCQGDLNLIKQLIEDPKVNEYVRCSAISSLVILYNSDQLSREDLVSYLGTILEKEDDPSLLSFIACMASDIHPKELYDVLAECFDQERLEKGVIDREDFDDCMQMDIETVLAELKENKFYQLINNVISEMEWWACFHPETHSKQSLSTGHEQAYPSTVGRNDPCPCGSGKKYKKCCLN